MDPSQPQFSLPYPVQRDEDPDVTLESLLVEQLKLARTIHDTLTAEKDTLSAREYKDLAAAANSILSLAHRSEGALRIITTYKKFVETVMEFLRSRSDDLGQDLVEELRLVAKTMRTEGVVEKMDTMSFQ